MAALQGARTARKDIDNKRRVNDVAAAHSTPRIFQVVLAITPVSTVSFPRHW
jgi:hypothetical protein